MADRGHDKRGVSGFREEEPDVDPWVPTRSVVTSVLLQKLIKDMEAYQAGEVAYGPRLRRNLRGEAARACEDFGIAERGAS